MILRKYLYSYYKTLNKKHLVFFEINAKKNYLKNRLHRLRNKDIYLNAHLFQHHNYLLLIHILYVLFFTNRNIEPYLYLYLQERLYLLHIYT